MARLKEKYTKEIRDQLMKELGIKNVMQVPKLEKIVLNMGVGDAVADSKKLTNAAEEMALIAGQKPVMTNARNSIAQFKLREGMKIGCKVTLRGDRMYEFLDRLVTIALPRIRDFRGVSPKSFDGHGNFAMGIKEQIIFPEINYDKVDKVRGMDIIICTNTNDNEHAKALLQKLNLPFRGEQKKAAGGK